jgi:hypothetical protein
MQQRVQSNIRRAAPRQTQPPSAKGAPTARKKVSLAARIFYLMRWTYHFITPIGMFVILWGIFEAATGKPDVAWPIIAGGAAFTFLANYFNKAR